MKVEKNFERRGFLKADLEATLEFISLYNAQPHLSKETHRRFLTHLVSSTEGIISIFERSVRSNEPAQRIALACVIDTCQNASNAALLEVLGLHERASVGFSAELALFILEEAFLEAQKSSKNFLEVPLSKGSVFTEESLSKKNFKRAYSMCRMRLGGDKLMLFKAKTPTSPLGFKIREAELADFDSYYRTLSEIFKNSLDTNVPAREEALRAFKARKIPVRLLVDVQDNQVVGHASIGVSEVQGQTCGEVNTIGILPSYQKRGLGDFLLRDVLQNFCSLHVGSVFLEVESANKAKILYEKQGFQVTEETGVYQRALKL